MSRISRAENRDEVINEDIWHAGDFDGVVEVMYVCHDQQLAVGITSRVLCVHVALSLR